MYQLKTKADFDGAHFLSGYVGKCKNIHGHHWVVEMEVGGDKLSESEQTRGMLVDFSELKEDVKRLADRFDHALIIEEGSLKEATMKALIEEDFHIEVLPFRPTAESFAKYFYDEMTKLGYEHVKATVYETENNCASYYEV